MVTEGTETVLDDPETAQYTHTLTGRFLGLYRCTVSNNKPSSVSRGVRVDGKMMSFYHVYTPVVLFLVKLWCVPVVGWWGSIRAV